MLVSHVPSQLNAALQAAAVVRSLASYRATVLPFVERQLSRWEASAAAIPDADLREAARQGLAKRSNVEATSVFATLAPLRRRRAVVQASTALQVAVDYLDVLSERRGPAALTESLRLHEALATALEPPGAFLPRVGEKGANRSAGEPIARREGEEAGDDGYLAELVATCRAAAASLPAAAAVLPVARREAQRCGEGQSHTHAAAGDPGPLEAWAAGLDAPPPLRWWEAAAGASSSVAAHALIALAARPGGSAPQAEAVAAAYDPWVGALTVLLDDLVDREADLARGEHSYLGYYDCDAEAAARLDLIAAGAATALRPLPRARGHEAILAGVLAYYLGSRREDPVAARVDAVDEPAVRLLSTLLHLAR